MSYDAVGHIIAETNALGFTTTYTYDNLNRQITKTDPEGHLTCYTYDADGNQITEINPLGGSTRVEFDLLNRQTALINSLGDAGNDQLYGQSGDDEMSGGDGDDAMKGDQGTDVFHGNGGADNMIGGRSTGNGIIGRGIASLTTPTATIHFLGMRAMMSSLATTARSPGQLTRVGCGSVSRELVLIWVVRITSMATTPEQLQAYGNDSLYGGDGTDELYGQLGNDYIDGGAGEDAIVGDLGEVTNRLEDGSRQQTIKPNQPFMQATIFKVGNLTRLVSYMPLRMVMVEPAMISSLAAMATTHSTEAQATTLSPATLGTIASSVVTRMIRSISNPASNDRSPSRPNSLVHLT